MTGGYRLADVRAGVASVITPTGELAGSAIRDDSTGRRCAVRLDGKWLFDDYTTRRLAVAALVEADVKAQERELADFIRATPPGTLETMLEVGERANREGES